MGLQQLPEILAQQPDFADALAYSAENTNFIAPEGLRPALLAGLYRQRRQKHPGGALLIIAATSREAEQYRVALSSIEPDADILELPAWETLPHEKLSPAAATVGARAVVFNRLRQQDKSAKPLILVASVRAVLQSISPFAAAASPLNLSVGDTDTPPADIAARLTDLGYTHVDLVAKRGEFALRGGILDVFSPAADMAVRIDFFGDEIDEIRNFAVADQRSTETQLTATELWPARELLLTEEVRARAEQLLAAGDPHTELLEKISAGIVCEGMESLLPLLVTDMAALTELLPPHSTVAVIAPERVLARAVQLAETNAEFLRAAWDAAAGSAEQIEQQTVINTGEKSGMLTLPAVKQALAQSGVWHTISPFAIEEKPDEDESADSLAVTVSAAAIPAVPPGVDAVEFQTGQIRDALTNGKQVIVAAGASGAAERALELLLEQQVPATAADDNLKQSGVAQVAQANSLSGFETEQLLLLSEADFFGRHISETAPKQRAGIRRRKNVVDPLQLQPGDYVVHDHHGIGRFVSLTKKQVTVGGRGSRQKSEREYLVLEYAASKRGMPADKLYIPIDQLGQLSRYVGGEAPALSKLGGSDWANTKKKARKAVRDIAVQLVKLYSARAAAKGHAFAPDTPWQHELEAAFPYVETADQLTAIAEVKRDMERQMPMDRLVSGDVGFGKTEIAVRAAFKAVQDNKQVAILVPTTLLVKQHFETFQNRFAGFPVRLKALSRFQSDKEAREVIAGLADGTVDVVIGTHRLLAKNVKYRDLGLIIIDEEQRFGVEHKDALKQLKTNVDVLAMSATPIPRTLEMAVTGIREMSTLATAPEERHPILTFVGPRNLGQTAAAIRREMLREGQIFYVHNRVASIGRVARELAEAVPEARVAVAHGKLSESELERVVVDFWEKKYDVLVCTTIVETGLDIANANTIIIDNADKYGLSQLHQLRGRVGRGRERAYAYFLYDPSRVLTETAHERLETIATHNELGSGMQVALRDLEIRGAGNLLGGEQSGHIAGVGFDMYLRLIGEAVDTFKGEQVHSSQDLTVELPVVIKIPDSYIDSERLRLEAYQKFGAASHPGAQADHVTLVLEELTDRYGNPPKEVEQLAALARLRRKAAKLGISRISVLNDQLRIDAVKLPDSKQVRLNRLYPGSSYSENGLILVPMPPALTGAPGLATSPLDRLYRGADKAADGDLLAWLDRLFESLFSELLAGGSAPAAEV